MQEHRPGDDKPSCQSLGPLGKDPAHLGTLTGVKGTVASEPDDDALDYPITAGFEAWYRSEYSRLVDVLNKLGADVAYSEEVAAEAFSRALERWDRVSLMDSPIGWTYRVAFNLLRRRQRRAAFELRALARPSPPRVPADSAWLWEEVRGLPTRQRQAVTLHYMLDLPYETVSEIMGVSEGTVAATLASARKRLAVRLSEETAEESK